MHKKTVIEASEQEIVNLINEFITPNYDGIVAAEELGNQDWTVTVEAPDKSDEEDVEEVISKAGDGMYSTRSILCVLCKMGHLEAGDYTIDCTW